MHTKQYPRYATVEKVVGETPLQALERLRIEMDIPTDVPMAYAGRLDPMASGKLLILIGEECKKQQQYHSLDKEYEVRLILGMHSDSGDVLGIIKQKKQTIVTAHEITKLFEELVGKITLPYPHFSSKTVGGKPLHLWTLEGRLDEISIPKKTSQIYTLTFKNLTILTKTEILATARQKVESIPTVTEKSKRIGADFRREKVRDAWRLFEQDGQDMYQMISFSCVASSGTYMRSLAEHIGEKLNTGGLAYSIHRTKMGRYIPIIGPFGFWIRRY